jgi:AraC-like DNA-binding protein
MVVAQQLHDARAHGRGYRASTFVGYTHAVERVIQTMRARLAEPLASPLSLDEMSEIACLSPFHFTRVFSAVTGLPPGEFSAALRLDAAKRRLLTTSLNVTDVCFDLGYTSLGTFGLRFKRLTGMSPLQLRQVAEQFTPLTPESVQRRAEAAAEVRRGRTGMEPAMECTGGVCGEVTAPADFAGLIFLGLFVRPIPQERPIACATIAEPGPFHLMPSAGQSAGPSVGLIADGRYFLFAAALPWSPHPMTYLAPDAGLLVGAGERAITLRAGMSHAPVHLTLRPRQLTDPPILGIFPPLQASLRA